MSCPLHSEHLGANQAWHGLGETGGGAGEACLTSHRSERAGVGSRFATASHNCLNVVTASQRRRSAKVLYCLKGAESLVVDKDASSYLHLFRIRRFLTR